MSPLLDKYEKVTYEHLKPICDHNGATVFAKVRLKDVLPVDGSGISAEDFGFSMKSHFDFVVVDRETRPLFAVEYDGAAHSQPNQAARDVRKNALCERFGLGLLRINSRYMESKFRGLDLLTYFVDVWFMREAFDEAQRNGFVSYDEDFDPWRILSDERSKKRFPYWLSADAQISLMKWHEARKIAEPITSDFVGKDAAGTYRCLSWIAIMPGKYAVIETGMRAQRFPVALADLVSQIATCDLQTRVGLVLAGKAETVGTDVLLAKLADYEKRYQVRSRAGYDPHLNRDTSGRGSAI